MSLPALHIGELTARIPIIQGGMGIGISLSTLRPFVSEEALNELSRLAAQYSDVNCTPEDIKLYLERIARGTPVASRAASMSTNDIEQYLQSMREQKQGTADAEDSV